MHFPLLTNARFQGIVQNRFGLDLDTEEVDPDILHLFRDLHEMIDVGPYVKLLGALDGDQVSAFARFFVANVNRHFSPAGRKGAAKGAASGAAAPVCVAKSIMDIAGNLDMQIACVICMQYYFT